MDCVIGSPGEIDSYTFAADAGDAVLVRMGTSGFDPDPEIRVFGPGAVLLCEDSTAGNSSAGVLAEISSCLLPTSGSYTILAGDLGGNGTGSYGIYLQRLNNPGNATTLPFGETVAATIDGLAEMDTYTFVADAGDAVLVRMGTSGFDPDPEIRVYGPDGVLVVDPQEGPCENSTAGNSSGGTQAEIGRCLLPEKGSYAILAGDLGGNDAGPYSVSLSCLIPSCGQAPPCPWDVNDDGVASLGDLALIALHWRHSADPPDDPEDPILDLNNDGIISLGDLAVVALHWRETCPP